jgi:hypothetical protein
MAKVPLVISREVHAKRFYISPCHFPGCHNFAHTRCIVEWCKLVYVAFDDSKGVGHYCRERFPGYHSLIHPLETYNGANLFAKGI